VVQPIFDLAELAIEPSIPLVVSRAANAFRDMRNRCFHDAVATAYAESTGHRSSCFSGIRIGLPPS
jgi:hypothetical protein